MKKTIVITALALILALMLPIFSFGGSETPDLVLDGGELLTESEEQSLQGKLEKLMHKHKMHFVIVTVDSLGNQSAYSYADSYYHNNGYGYGEDDDGILLLLSMEYRDYYIYTYGEAEDEFGDSELTELEDAMLPYFADNEFYEGFVAFADACDGVLSFDILTNLMIALAIGLAVSLIIVFSMKAKLKSVRPQRAAANYVRRGSFNETKHLDLFLYRSVTRTKRAENNSSSRSSGGGSRGGGRGGKF